jgi:uncharacterized repeat protein (TIGR01451 family)
MTTALPAPLLQHPATGDVGAIRSFHPITPAPMSRSTRCSIALLALSLFGASSAHAQRSASHESAPTLVVGAVNTTAGREGAQGSTRIAVLPNDVLRYTLTLTNPTSRSLANVELRNPMPAGLRYVPGSAHASRSDARLEFSADGGRSWAAEPVETVLVAGQPVTRPIPVERYTHIRWIVAGSVASNAVVRADFEARVGGA